MSKTFFAWAMIMLTVVTVAVTLTMLSHLYSAESFSERSRQQRYEKEKCRDLSPAFPSAGGPGCKYKCELRNGQKTFSFGVVFLNNTHNWPKSLLNNMHLAGSILKKYGAVRSLDTERPIYLHVAFDYYCCYKEDEAIQIGEFLNSYSWTPQTASFDKIVCAVHSRGDLVSLVLMLDQNSQKKLLKIALQSEADLEKATGISKNIPHSQLQGFHMTLATVNQRHFPVQSALQEINAVIPPGKWHKTPVIFHTPVCRRCNAIISSRKKYS